MFLNPSKKVKLIITLVSILTVIVSVIFIRDFVLKGIREKYCLDKILEKHGIEKPMVDEKWDDFTRCYNTFTFSNFVDSLRR